MKVYVLSARAGTELMAPVVFTDFNSAQKALESRFDTAVRNLEEYCNHVDGECETGYALLESSTDTIEWKIEECEVQS